MPKEKNLKYGIAILVILHMVGVFGILSPYSEWFVALTPINLLISLGLIFYYQEQINANFILVAGFIMVSSFFLEMVGVNTGYPFGEYTYGNTLGVKWIGTPLMIGVNWFFMSYCASFLLRGFTKNTLFNAFLAGVLVTCLDYIMEPVAIKYDFWTWSGVEIPIQNYITWVIGMTLYVYIIFKYLPNATNKIAKWVLFIQALFFLILFIANSL